MLPPGEHDPVEDARAALDLALLKFERGPAYGAAAGERGDRLLDVLGAGRCGAAVQMLRGLVRCLSRMVCRCSCKLKPLCPPTPVPPHAGAAPW